MKNFYLLIFAVLFCLLAQAQIKKGDIVLGGDIGYSDESGNNGAAPVYTNKNWNINPSVGRAFKDNFVLGLDISYSHGTSAQGDPISYTSTADVLGAGFFLRRYKPLGNNFYLFCQAMLDGSYSHGSSTSLVSGSNPSSGQSDNKGVEVRLQIYPGISYAINRHWQLETGLPNFFVVDYTHSKQTTMITGQPDQNSYSHSFGILSSLTGNNEFAVGVRYFIGG
jgi:hypothetical protein